MLASGNRPDRHLGSAPAETGHTCEVNRTATRFLAGAVALAWLFCLLMVVGILAMSAAHATSATWQAIATGVVVVVAVLGLAGGAAVVRTILRSALPRTPAP